MCVCDREKGKKSIPLGWESFYSQEVTFFRCQIFHFTLFVRFFQKKIIKKINNFHLNYEQKTAKKKVSKATNLDSWVNFDPSLSL